MIAHARNGNVVFSTDVSLCLELSDANLQISTVEPDRLVLAEPRQLGDCDAVLVISVNGEPRRTPIRIAASDAPAREFAYTVR